MADWEKVKGGAQMPPGDWTRITPLMSVQGVHHRKEAARTFAKFVLRVHDDGRPFGLIVEPEPTNSYDANALKIVGWCRGVAYHVGYVEAIEAARAAERFPDSSLAAEFYSLYQGRTGFIDIRFFLSVPQGTPFVSSDRVRSLLEATRDELMVLAYAARADDKLGRLEHDILHRYAQERAKGYADHAC